MWREKTEIAQEIFMMLWYFLRIDQMHYVNVSIIVFTHCTATNVLILWLRREYLIIGYMKTSDLGSCSSMNKSHTHYDGRGEESQVPVDSHQM